MRTLVNIDVPTLPDAIAFYTTALGLIHTRTLDDDVAELTGASSTIYLLAHAAGTPWTHSGTGTRSYTRHWTPVHLDFVVDDLEQARQRALNAGARQESECVDWRGSHCITFADPFGHGFCLIAFDGDGYD